MTTVDPTQTTYALQVETIAGRGEWVDVETFAERNDAVNAHCDRLDAGDKTTRVVRRVYVETVLLGKPLD